MALFEPGDVAGAYRIVRPMGVNHRHETYLASIGQSMYVLKTVSRGNPYQNAVSDDMRRQFAFLNTACCPVAGISCYEELFDFEGFPIITMRYISGDPTKTRIEDHSWRTTQRVDFLVDLGHSLDELHDYGVTHRDVSTANVLVVGAAHSHLIDFDLSVFGPLLSDDEMSLISGSPEFKAPEQWAGHAQDRSVDAFAFGVLAYAVLARQQPISCSKDFAQYLNALYLLPVPRSTRDLIAACLTHDPSNRPFRLAEIGSS